MAKDGHKWHCLTVAKKQIEDAKARANVMDNELVDTSTLFVIQDGISDLLCEHWLQINLVPHDTRYTLPDFNDSTIIHAVWESEYYSIDDALPIEVNALRKRMHLGDAWEMLSLHWLGMRTRKLRKASLLCAPPRWFNGNLKRRESPGVTHDLDSLRGTEKFEKIVCLPKPHWMPQDAQLSFSS